MGFSLTSLKFLGGLGENSWASVFETGEDRLILPRGKLWVVFSAKLKDDLSDKISLSREIFSFFYNNYYQRGGSSNFYALKTATLEAFKYYRDKFVDFEIGSLSYSEKERVLNAAVVNGAWIGLLRSGIFSKILEGRDDVVAASGYPMSGDYLALGTKSSFLPFSTFDFRSFIVDSVINNEGLKLVRERILKEDKEMRSALFLLSFSSLDSSVALNENVSKTIARKKNLLKSFLIRNIPKPGRVLPLDYLKIFFDGRLKERRVFVKKVFRSLDEKEEEKKKLFFPALLITSILAISVLGRNWKISKERNDFLLARLNDAFKKTEDSKNIYPSDYQTSRNLLWSAKETVSFLEKEKYRNKRLDDLKKKIKEQEESILKEFYVTPSIFSDLSLLAADFKIDSLISDGYLIVVFDKEGKRVARIYFGTKKTEAVAGPSDFDNYQGVALYAGKIFVLTDKGFFDVEDNSKMLFRNDFGDDALVFSYAGNVYVLDKDASRIYRITSSGGEFSLPQIWTASNLNIDFSKTKDWFIDGFIWILYEDGKILKFNKGVPVSVVLKYLFPNLEKIQSIYSNEETDFLYVLDNVLGRVIVFDKSGNYFAQYFSEELKGSKNIVVSEKEKQLVFSKEESKLYLIQLKHLE